MGKIAIVGPGCSRNGILAIREAWSTGTMNQSPSADAKQGLQLALDRRGKDLQEQRSIIPMPKIKG
jgi:hypothetical protein